VLAGDGLVPFGILTELDALSDDGFAFHDLHDHNFASAHFDRAAALDNLEELNPVLVSGPRPVWPHGPSPHM